MQKDDINILRLKANCCRKSNNLSHKAIFVIFETVYFSKSYSKVIFPPVHLWSAGRLAVQAGAAAKQPSTRDVVSSLTSLTANTREIPDILKAK